MYIGFFLQNLDEEYQKMIYLGVREEARRLGLGLLCIKGENFKLERGGEDYFLSAAKILPLSGGLLLSSILVLEDDLLIKNDFRRVFEEIPFVSIGKEIQDVPSLLINSEDSLSVLMSHLIDTHHYRHFLYIGGSKEQEDNLIRENSVKDRIEKAGLIGDDYSLTIMNNPVFSIQGGGASIQKYIEENPQRDIDVIVCGNDNTAMGVLKYLKTQIDSSWENCPVTGFDDIPQAELLTPPLTTIRQPLIELGMQAVWLLAAKLKGEEIPLLNHIDTAFVLRKSCGCREWIDRRTRESSWDSEEKILLQDANSFGQNLMNVNNYSQLYKVVKESFLLLGLKEYFFVYFSEPTKGIPSKGILLAKKREKIIIQKGVDNFFERDSEEHSEFSFIYLSYGEEKLGFILYRSEERLHPFMTYSRVFLSNALKKIQFLESEKNRSRELENLVVKRTTALKEEAEKRLRVEEEILKISDLERMRFSSDLHDDICERLASIAMFSQDDSIFDGGSKIDKITVMIYETLKQTKHYANNAFPIELEQVGLIEALWRLTINYTNNYNIKCQIAFPKDLHLTLSNQFAVNIYRIVQDALQNVVIHSLATEAEVSILKKKGELIVRVNDNGIGNPEIEETSFVSLGPQRPRGLGLKSMKYRANLINGEFIIRSSKESGTSINLTVPLPQDD